MGRSPLKLSVNLYSVDLLPVKLRLSFLRLLSVLVTVPCAAALYSGFAYVQQQGLTAELNQADLNLQHLTGEQASLKQKLDQHKPAADMVQRLEHQRTKLRLTQQLLAKAGVSEHRQSGSYQALLTDLAQAADGSTWLTGIEVDGDSVSLSGETQNAAAVPAWIKRLSRTASLADAGFEQLIISRDQNDLLRFEVNSQTRDKRTRGEAEWE